MADFVGGGASAFLAAAPRTTAGTSSATGFLFGL